MADLLSARSVLALPDLYPGRYCREGADDEIVVVLHFVPTRDGWLAALSTLEVTFDHWGDVERLDLIDGLDVDRHVRSEIAADLASKRPALQVSDADELIALSRRYRGKAA